MAALNVALKDDVFGSLLEDSGVADSSTINYITVI